ncbi:MAG: GAF domain-containing protein [Chloroflexi bacterium]|nr:GAF domain-containing protein [Chloroflexota bacterium]MBI3170546.1 GAF domain-containing protein [Chloroflexota bacterium]
MTNSGISTPTFDLKEWRESFIRIVLRIASVLGIVMIGVSFPTASFTDRILFFSLYLILLSITVLPTPYLLRAYLLLTMTTAVGVNAIAAWGPWADGSIFLLATVTLAALLLDNRTDIVVLAASIIFSIVIAFLNLQGSYQLAAPNAPAVDIWGWGVYITDFAIAGIVITTATNMLKSAFASVVNQMLTAFQSLNTERQNLENKVQERTVELETRMNQLRASTLTVRAIAETREVNELLKNAASLISERFEYYHVGIFILDELKRNAYLQASSSETGTPLLGQSFRIEPDRKNPLATVVESNRTIITSDIERSNFVRDPNFPLTRSRMVMPLSVRGNQIGIIDIHSDQPRAFSSEDAEILQTLADLTAISFDNVRLLDETRNLLTQLEANTTQQTQRTWSKFTSRHKNAYQYTPAGVRPVFSPEKVKEIDGLYVPITLHGQEIGRIKLKKRKGSSNEWSDRERDLVEKISVQVALALENNRLVDEAQKNALRNQMIASFSTYVRETLDVDAVIRTATTELRKVFDLKEAEILIGPAQPASQPSQSTNA